MPIFATRVDAGCHGYEPAQQAAAAQHRAIRATLVALAAIASVALIPFAGRNAAKIAQVSQPGVAVHAESAGVESAPLSRPATVIRLVSCTILPDVPNKSIATAIVEFPPHAFSPRHRHPGSVTAFVLSGTLRSQLVGEPVGTYTAAQTWFEPPGAIHLFAENASASEPAQLLAIFITDHDCGPLTIPE
jgi:quercetin dioxygenase-like cupin family protein